MITKSLSLLNIIFLFSNLMDVVYRFTTNLGEGIKDASEYGWGTDPATKHDWAKMVTGIQDHIGSLNWGYRVSLR